MSATLITRYLRGRARFVASEGRTDAARALSDEADRIAAGAWRSCAQKTIDAAVRSAPPSIVRRPIRITTLEGDARARALARVERTIERDRLLGTAPEAVAPSDRLLCGHVPDALREETGIAFCGECSKE